MESAELASSKSGIRFTIPSDAVSCMSNRSPNKGGSWCPKLKNNICMRSEIAKRNEVECGSANLESSVDKMRKQRWGVDV